MQESQKAGTSEEQQGSSAQAEVLPPKDKRDTVITKKRKDWLRNSRAIQNALVTYWKDHKRPPTNSDIAKLASLSETTVEAHFRETDFQFVFDHLREKYASLSEPVFMSIFNAAMGGNARSQEMMLQIIHNWSKPSEVKLSGEVGVSTPVEELELDEVEDRLDLLQTLRDRVKERKTLDATRADGDNTGSAESPSQSGEASDTTSGNATAA